jgi:hypothetical protein
MTSVEPTTSFIMFATAKKWCSRNGIWTSLREL